MKLLTTVVTAAALVACGGERTPAPVPPPALVPAIAPASPGIELPEVPLVGYAVADDVVPKIAVSPTAFTIAGKQVLALKDGVLAPGDVAKLEGAIGVDVATGVPGVALAFDRRVPFATLATTVRLVHARGAKRFQLLARSGANQVAVAFERAAPLPTKQQLEALQPIAELERLRVAMIDTHLRKLDRCAPKGTTGRLQLQLVVTREGRIESVKLAGADPAHECIRTELATWKIEPAPSRDLGLAFQFALPSWTPFDPHPNARPGGAHIEIKNGKKVYVIDEVIVIESPALMALELDRAQVRVLDRHVLDGVQPAPPIVVERSAATPFTDLAGHLAEYVKARWWRGRLYEIDHELAIDVRDPAAQIQLLAEMFGAVRVAPDGFPLFPELRLVVP